MAATEGLVDSLQTCVGGIQTSFLSAYNQMARSLSQSTKMMNSMNSMMEKVLSQSIVLESRVVFSHRHNGPVVHLTVANTSNFPLSDMKLTLNFTKKIGGEWVPVPLDVTSLSAPDTAPDEHPSKEERRREMAPSPPRPTKKPRTDSTPNPSSEGTQDENKCGNTKPPPTNATSAKTDTTTTDQESGAAEPTPAPTTTTTTAAIPAPATTEEDPEPKQPPSYVHRSFCLDPDASQTWVLAVSPQELLQYNARAEVELASPSTGLPLTSAHPFGLYALHQCRVERSQCPYDVAAAAAAAAAAGSTTPPPPSQGCVVGAAGLSRLREVLRIPALDGMGLVTLRPKGEGGGGGADAEAETGAGLGLVPITPPPSK